MIIPDQKTVYHVISRTVLDGYSLGDEEKDELVKILLKFSKLYFTEVLGFCVTGDHFHLLVRMLPESDFSDDEIKSRYTIFYGNVHLAEQARGPGKYPDYESFYSAQTNAVDACGSQKENRSHGEKKR
jgi:hypothetical protein